MSRTLALLLFSLNVVLVAAPSGSAFAEAIAASTKNFSGKVVGIKDGDTIVVLKNKKPVTVRLYGVDCPERKTSQPYNRNAKEFTSGFVFEKNVNVEVWAIDRYKRTVGVVTTQDGKNLNQALIENGWAWVYEYFCKVDFCKEWLKLEAKAKKEKKGLWKDKNPIAPWSWRRTSQKS